MIRSLAGILALLVLYLAARNARLEDRQRILEDKLAAAEARPKSPWKQTPPSPAPLPEAAPAPLPGLPSGAAPSAAAKVPSALKEAGSPPGALSVEFPQTVQGLIDQRLRKAAWQAQGPLTEVTYHFVLAQNDGALGLSPSQKQAIDQLRAIRDARNQAYQDEIGKIESETEDSIRQLLTADQRAQYDGQKNAVAVVADAPNQETPLPAGVQPGYLGISGEDVKGGGVRLTSVMDSTAAAGAGLKAGDVILDINGEPMTNYTALASKIRSTGEGTPVVLRILRDGSEFTQGLQLGPRPK